MADTYAVLLNDDEPLDLRVAAEAMAEVLGFATADVLQLLGLRSGILIEGLDHERARICAGSLQHEGISVRVVPDAKVVELPELLTLTAARVLDEGLEFLGDGKHGVASWNELVWIDLVHVHNVAQEKFDDWKVVKSGGGRMNVNRYTNQRAVSRWPPHVDIVSYEPWLLLRIPQDGFQFATTGLKVHENRKQNLNALCIAVASRAPDISLGPGMQWFRDGSPPRENRVPGDAVYRNSLRWRLTNLFLETA